MIFQRGVALSHTESTHQIVTCIYCRMFSYKNACKGVRSRAPQDPQPWLRPCNEAYEQLWLKLEKICTDEKRRTREMAQLLNPKK